MGTDSVGLIDKDPWNHGHHGDKVEPSKANLVVFLLTLVPAIKAAVDNDGIPGVLTRTDPSRSGKLTHLGGGGMISSVEDDLPRRSPESKNGWRGRIYYLTASHLRPSTNTHVHVSHQERTHDLGSVNGRRHLNRRSRKLTHLGGDGVLFQQPWRVGWASAVSSLAQSTVGR